MDTLLEGKDVTKDFPIEKGILSKLARAVTRTQELAVHAVTEVSFEVKEGETLALVGESGSGKSTLGKLVLRLIEPTSGTIIFEDKDITKMKRSELRKLRKDMQIIFQDPSTSLNPSATVRQIVGHPMRLHGITRSREETEARLKEILHDVGLTDEHLDRYPHQFSGGQKQRIAIARAIGVRPRLLVADEAVSALDVSVQAQIMNLLVSLKSKYNLTYLFISHDLGVVRYVSDRIAVMYLGRIVEVGKTDDILNHPTHPYTQALLSAVPVPDPKAKKKRVILTGDMPSSVNPPPGCRFNTRCPYVMPVCKEVKPDMTDLGGAHYAACHLLTQGSGATQLH